MKVSLHNYIVQLWSLAWSINLFPLLTAKSFILHFLSQKQKTSSETCTKFINVYFRGKQQYFNEDIVMLFKLNWVNNQQFFRMQRKIDSKQKLTQYNSTKDFQSNKQSTHKISTRPPQPKSNPTQILNKANPQSTSKTKLNSKPVKHNENFNSINVPENIQKNKSTHHQSQNLKKQPRKEEKLIRNSSQKLIKSKSTLKIAPKTERNRHSQSPIMCKQQPKQVQKSKMNKSARNKTDKEKKIMSKTKEEKQGLKRSSSMAVYQTKRQNTERNNVNRVSIKTEVSSKMNSVIKDDMRFKKYKKSAKRSITKKQESQGLKQKKAQKTKLQNKIKKSILYSQVSFQQFCQQNPCESALVANEKFYQLEGYTKVKTEGCQASYLENRFTQKNIVQLQVSAVTKIQKVFRGYITRKYIQQAKIIVAKVKIIQKWWRNMLMKRKRKPNKPSVENSLITIKDFNETMKSQRQKLFSQPKENTLSNRKLSIKEIIKNILQENQNESQKSVIISQKKLKDACLSPEQNVITKQVYIEQKIKAQINSQKVFNSPKVVTSPRSLQTPTSLVSIKDFFNNSSERQKFKQMLQSPKMKSPQPPKSTPKSIHKQEQPQKFQIYKELVSQVEPFQTNFQAIQQISLILVDYFRDRPNEMTKFLNRLQKMKYFRTQLILKNWKEYKLLSQSYYNQMEDSILPADYQYLQLFQRPELFPVNLRQDIIEFPSFQVDLNSKNYNLYDATNLPIHRCYLQFFFDVLEEAFYQSYKGCVLQWNSSLNLRLYDNEKDLFQFAFSDALGYFCKWGEIMCGFMVNHPEDFVQQRQERMKLMEKQIEPWDLGKANKLGIKIQISQKIEEDLLFEISSYLIKIQR